MKKQKKYIAILSVLIIIALSAMFFLKPKEDKEIEVVPDTPVDVIEKDNGKYNFEEYYAINDDYVGHIYFESGIIDLPFVQGQTNETYYRNDWQTLAHDEEGSIFLDYRNDLNSDENNIIYGHNVAVSYEASKTHKFTPLHLLTDKANYEENKYFNLELEDRIERYEVALVYRCAILEEGNNQYIIEDEPTFYYTNFTQDEFNTYISKAKERSYYDTGLELTINDKMVTLQTCYEDSPDKLIVVGKLIETIE